MEIHTIGFTKHTAAEFFGKLEVAGVQRLLDVRLHNSSQLAGFTKRVDLEFFLTRIVGAAYEHEPLLAPTPELLDAYRKKLISWSEYERHYVELLRARQVEERIDRSSFVTPTVLLCSEATPARCHRRLALEYLAELWPEVTPHHL